MPACPNCGRQTLRTKDWACQWCGYPLISRAYKIIDKTYKELQEERNLPPKYEEAETDTIQEPEAVAETQPEPPPQPKRFSFFRREPKPKPEPAPEAPSKAPETPLAPQPAMKEEPLQAPETPPAPSPEPGPEPQVKPEPETPPAPQPAIKEEPSQAPETPPAPSPEPGPEPQVKPEPEAKPSPPPAASPVQGPEPQIELRPEAELPPAPEPEPVPQLPPRPEPEPVAVIPLDSIKDGMEITVDQLNVLFKAEKSNADARFKDKVVVVKGLVEKVFVREHLEIRYIVMTGSRKKDIWSVRCSFEKEGAAGLNRLNEGEETAVRGTYDGFGKNIIFKNCSLV